jgi:leucyl-tRNA synthetase
MIFASPPADDIDWADMRPEASVKFLGRCWRLAAPGVDRTLAGRGVRAIIVRPPKLVNIVPE